MQADLSSEFSGLFAEFMNADDARALAGLLAASPHASDLLSLFSELRECSRKVASLAIDTLPSLAGAVSDEVLLLWADLAVSLTQRSGAIGLKYCSESEAILQLLPPALRSAALRIALELADQDGPLALEAFRQVGAVTARTGIDKISVWSNIGADLARCDYVIGVEYFRRSPELLSSLTLDDLKAWAAISLKLVTTNSLGKPDYIAALTYLRTSAVLLADLPTTATRRRLLALVLNAADRDPEVAIVMMGETPGLLHRIALSEWQERVLQYGLLVVENDAASCLAYLRRAPEVIDLIGANEAGASSASGSDRFDGWFKGAMEVLDYNPEAARAYFATETRQALEAIETAASGVALKKVVRVLKLFAEGLSGKPLSIRPQQDEAGEPISVRSTSGEGIIWLPVRVRRYPTREDNLRLYKLMTAHEAGHFEYGTYDLDLSRLGDLAAQACLRYGRQVPATLGTLDDLFQCYPQPFLIRDLWKLAEDARIDASLKAEYAGLRRDMEELRAEEQSKRSLTHGMSIKEMIVELLLQLSAEPPEAIRIPFALEEVVNRAWALLRSAIAPYGSAEAVVRAVHRTYVLIEELTAPSETWSAETTEESTAPDTPRQGEAQGETYRPLVNFVHRGSLEAARVSAPMDDKTQSLEEPGLDKEAWDDQGPGTDSQGAHGRHSVQPTDRTERLSQARSVDPDLNKEPDTGMTGGVLSPKKSPRIFFYDEWDGVIQDYRNQWCRVIEERGSVGSSSFVEQTKITYGGTIRTIRRYFEGIRPVALQRMRRQRDGEEVDMEAAIESLVDRQAQASPTEDVYIRRDRRERDVAVAFLVDLSGSTGRQIGAGGTRIIDVEKEAMVLLAEALEAIGDQYALYGFSGQSRREVQFQVLKDFEERYGPAIWERIDAVRPLEQNRDGAAIRHAAHRLSARFARVKLLVLLSDGRPLDDLYADEYALEDTKAALREAKAKGVHVFCITVDDGAVGYLGRMYGEVSYTIIDRVQSLPERLPRIYRMLTT